MIEKHLDGKKESQKIKEELKKTITKLKKKPKLVVLQIGDKEESNIYIKAKEKMAQNIDILFEHKKYPSSIKEEEIIKEIKILNQDKNITGILLQLPIPDNLNAYRIINHINDKKDVDGLTDKNLGALIQNKPILTPCTPTGILTLLKNENLEGKNIVIVNRSTLIGKPLLHLLLNQNATVTICHSKTKNLKTITKQADILIVAVGIPNWLKKDMIKKDVILIDVGIHRIHNKLCGDIDYQDVIQKAKKITPVPGGIGPMTVATLMQNVVKAQKIQE